MLKKFWKQDLILFCLIFMKNGFLAFEVYSTREFIAAIQISNLEQTFLWSGLTVIALLAFRILLFWNNKNIYKLVSKKILFQKLQKLQLLSTNFYELKKENIGYFQNKFINQADKIKNDYYKVFYIIIDITISLFLMSIISIVFSWIILLILISFVLVNALFSFGFEKIYFKYEDKIFELQEKYNQKIWNILENTKKFIFYAQFKNWISWSSKSGNKFYFENNRQLNKTDLLSALWTVFGISLQILLVLVLGIFYFNKFIDFSSLIASVTLVSFLFTDSSDFLYYMSKYKTIKRIFKKWNVTKTKKLSYKSELIKTITVSNLKSDFLKVPHLLNFKFEANKKYLIIGSSGIGKTSLFNFIFGLNSNYEGRIEINQENFKLQNTVPVFNDWVFIAANNTYVFDASLNQNITLFEQTIDQTQLAKSKAQAQINFHNVDQPSSGEKQRINLARTIYANKKWIFLDESLSNVDQKTSQAIERELLQNTKITLIHIAHNINEENLKLYDYVFQFDDEIKK
ncbi:ATP-binding cassette domain-containing protein [Candidatus Mycoplasma pogonae]